MIEHATSSRDGIIEALRFGLEPDDRVLALHLGGSAATGRVDEWSDIDAVVTVDDDAVERAFELVETALRTIAPIEVRHRMPEPTWHGHAQCFYALRDAPACNMVDLVVMKRSAPERFLDVERHGRPTVLFDKEDLVVSTSLDRLAHAERICEHLDLLESRFHLFRSLVTKSLDRGHIAEAVHFYNAFSYRPLLDLLRIVHCPERFDFGPRYLDRDVPPEVRADLERLALAGDPETLRRHHAEIEHLVGAALPIARVAAGEFARC